MSEKGRKARVAEIEKKMKPGKEGREETLMGTIGMFGFHPKNNRNYQKILSHGGAIRMAQEHGQHGVMARMEAGRPERRSLP
mgnify:CR=1 FL=1